MRKSWYKFFAASHSAVFKNLFSCKILVVFVNIYFWSKTITYKIKYSSRELEFCNSYRSHLLQQTYCSKTHKLPDVMRPQHAFYCTCMSFWKHISQHIWYPICIVWRQKENVKISADWDKRGTTITFLLPIDKEQLINW